MNYNLFNNVTFANTQEALDFITNILESSTEYSIIGKDLDGTIVLWNEGARRLYGYAPQEVIGKNSALLHTAEDIQKGTPRIVLDTALTEGKWEGTLKRVRKDGSLFSARVTVTPRRDALGKPLGFLLISKDISVETQLTDELRTAQFYARSLIEASLDPLVTISPDGKITDVNQASVQVTGVRREELIGTDFSNYFTEPARARAGYQQVFSQGFVRDYPLAIRHGDGHITEVLYNASLYRDGKGNVLGVFAAARDVTERNRAELRLRGASAYARSLIESSLDPLVTISPHGKITDVNQATELVTGVPRQQLIGTDFSDYFTEPERAREGYRQVFQQGYVRDYPLAIRHATGRITDVLYNASLYRDEKGNVLGVFAAARDITQRKMAEELQRAATYYARSLIEASLDPLVTINTEGKITDVNEASVQATGVVREELIGTDFSDYFTEPEKAREGYQQVFKEGFVRDYPLAIRHRNSPITDVLYNASIYHDDKGRVLGVFAAARDMTAVKRASQYARSLIEASLDPLVTISAEGKITDVNEASVQVTGVLREELIGTDFSDYFTEPDKAREGYQQVFKEGFVRDYPLAIRHRDGQIIEVLYNASLYRDDKGRVLGVFAAARDMTERRRFERSLEEANRAKDEFLANMSHELRTPLNSVLGFSEILLEQTRGPLNERQVQAVQLIASSGQHLLGLINDILEVAKIEAGKLDIYPEEIDVQALCQSSLDFIRESAIKKSLRLEFRSEPQISTLRADPQRLKQILVNLLSNAVKFTPDYGRVTLEVTSNAENDQIQFAVTDTGIGIASEDLDKLFIPFTQLDRGLSRQYEGTGLGLVLVYKFTELHGGSVGVESAVGRGSRFVVNLPWSPTAAIQPNRGESKPGTAEEHWKPAPPSAALGVILLAEDNLSNLLTVNEYLQDVGYAVIVAQNGLEALAKAEEVCPDIILMDIQMPELDGLQAIRRLRTMTRFAATPIIALTALAMPGDRERCLEAGANEYMSKPVSLKLLVKTVQGFLQLKTE